MSDDNQIPLEHLSDRELLLLACQSIRTHGEEIKDHREEIKTLTAHKNWLAGAVAVFGTLLGIHAGKH